MNHSRLQSGRPKVRASAGEATRARTTLGSPRSRDVYADRQLASIAARWDARAATWEEALRNPSCHLNEDRAYARFLDYLRESIAERRAFCAQHGVIDAGCGTGLVLKEVIGSFAWGVGVDISRRMIRAARSKRLERARFLIGDCWRLAAICQPVGAVVSRGVLLSHYGLRRGEGLLRSARAALVPGGFALFDFLNASGRRRFSHTAADKHWLYSAQVRALALRAGFRKARVLGERHRRARVLIAE